MGFTITSKAFSTVGNIVLAWFLMPEAFGLVAMTWSVVSLAGLVQNIGAMDVLVQRHGHLRRWATPGFWMALLAGVAGMGLALAAIPAAMRVYGEPRLGGMIAVLSLMLPLRALMVVPQAQLALSLRFRLDATIHGMATMTTMMLSIILASIGFGAYSMVVPVPLVLVAQVILMWSVAPVRVRARPQLRRWRFLLSDVGYAWGVEAMVVVIIQANLVVLGVFHRAEVVGLFFVAYNLSTQIFTLLVRNLMVVLLPSLSLLGRDRARQARGFLEATRLVMALGLPACLCLAAVAEPLIAVVYRDAYGGVGPMLAALAAGMGLYLPAGPAISMMKAQGRFRALFLTFLANALVLIPLLGWASAQHQGRDAAEWVALVTAGVYTVFGPVFLVVTAAGSVPVMLALRRVYAGPLLASMVAIGSGLAASLLVPAGAWNDAARLVVTPLVAGPLYLVFVRWISPGLWSTMVARVRTTPLLRTPREAPAVEPLTPGGA